MRWLPSLSFSHVALKSSSSSSSFRASDVDHPKKKPADTTRTPAGVWPFGSSKKPGRPWKLADGKSPPRGQESDEDAVGPLTRSPSSFDRLFHRSSASSCSTSSVVPQPLPLPDSAFPRQKDGDCPLPSPKELTRPSSAGKLVEERDRGGLIDGVSSVLRIRR